MSAYGVTDWLTYVMGAIGIILLPGPNSLFVLSVATGRGVRSAFRAADGVFVGDTILLLLVALLPIIVGLPISPCRIWSPVPVLAPALPPALIRW